MKNFFALLAAGAVMIGSMLFAPVLRSGAEELTASSSNVNSAPSVTTSKVSTASDSGEWEGIVYDEHYPWSDGKIYSCSDSGKLYSIDPATGKIASVYDFSQKSPDGYVSIRGYCLSGSKFYCVFDYSYWDDTSGYTNKYYLQVYDLSQKKIVKTLSVPKDPGEVAVDGKGRIYVAAGNNVVLYSSDYKKLSTAALGSDNESELRFIGFDKATDKFYYARAYYKNTGSNSYTRVSGLYRGSAANDKLSLSKYPLKEGGFFRTSMLGSKYIAELSDNYWYPRINVYDASVFPTTTKSTFPEPKMVFENEHDDVMSAGPGAVYNSKLSSVIVYTGNKTLGEYNKNGNKRLDITTKAPVTDLMINGTDVYALEYDGTNCYIQKFPWTHAQEISISGSSSVDIGKSIKLKPQYSSIFDEPVTWTSSDPLTASVSRQGVLYAVKAGKVTVTAKLLSGATAEKTVTVNKTSLTAPKFATKLSGKNIANAGENDYYTAASVMNSSIYQDEDGTIGRVQFSDGKLLVEKYSADGKTKLSSKTIKAELPLYGGFYCGTKYNYVVWGQSNPDCKDSVEVIRVVKYYKNWERIRKCTVKGANTFYPFDWGCARMAEYSGKLYLHTCHTMYDGGDGLHHQANMTYVFKTSDLTLVDKWYDVMNLGYGYVSHSFNQFIQTDGKYVFRCDHGEGYPNGIAVTRFKVGDSVTNVDASVPVIFDNVVGNYTGTSVGGFEISPSGYVIAYSQDIVAKNGSSFGRNVYICVGGYDLSSSKKIKLTSYTKDSGKGAMTPQLVKINDNIFMVLWEERSSGNTFYLLVDAAGRKLTSVTELPAELSDCQPVLCQDGNVRWYTCSDRGAYLYALNPFKAPALKKISETKASLRYYSYTCATDSWGWSYEITPDNINGRDDLTVKYGDTVLKKGRDFTVRYENNLQIGYKTAKLIIRGINNYVGTKTVSFTIKPQKVYSVSLSSWKNGIRVDWDPVDGALAYQVLYSKTKDFKEYHSTTVKGKTTVNLTSIPRPGQKWYVKVRGFITSNGKLDGVRYGNYSDPEEITVTESFGSITIPYSSYTYKSGGVFPAVTVKSASGKKLTRYTDYDYYIWGNDQIGTATIYIYGCGKYSNVAYYKYFIVKPKKNSITSLTSDAKNTFTVKYNKAVPEAAGYQILYAKNKDFTKECHSTTVTSLSQLSKKVSSNVKSGDVWYVKVRSFVTVYSYSPVYKETRYGNYSDVRSVKIK